MDGFRTCASLLRTGPAQPLAQVVVRVAHMSYMAQKSCDTETKPSTSAGRPRVGPTSWGGQPGVNTLVACTCWPAMTAFSWRHLLATVGTNGRYHGDPDSYFLPRPAHNSPAICRPITKALPGDRPLLAYIYVKPLFLCATGVLSMHSPLEASVHQCSAPWPFGQ